MTIYIDSDYKCHTSPGDGLTASVKKTSEVASPWQQEKPIHAAEQAHP